jgi:hypothetical protein
MTFGRVEVGGCRVGCLVDGIFSQVRWVVGLVADRWGLTWDPYQVLSESVCLAVCVCVCVCVNGVSCVGVVTRMGLGL